MSESASETPPGNSAGALLRAARERQGMHIAALAASIKITVAKLEALENDRFDELPDATFTRALALTVCRALKIDPQPVLAHLPRGGPTGLGKVTGGLNMPLRDRPGRSEPVSLGFSRGPMIWLALLVLAAAVVIYLLPPGLWRDGATAQADDVVGSSASASMAEVVAPAPGGGTQRAAQGQSVEVVHLAPPPDVASPVANAPPAEAPPQQASEAASAATSRVQPDVLVLRADKASWVQVIDGKGAVLIKRTLQPGENVSLEGDLPLRLTVGNASTTKAVFRGEAVDLSTSAVGNVARLELK